MFEKEKALFVPYQDTLQHRICDSNFKQIVREDIWNRVDMIRRMGNEGAHGEKLISEKQAEQCLENLFLFLVFVARRYGGDKQKRAFNKKLLELTPEEAVGFSSKKTGVSDEELDGQVGDID